MNLFPLISRVAAEGRGHRGSSHVHALAILGVLLLLPRHSSDEGFQMAPGLDPCKIIGAGKAISFPVRAVCVSVCEVQRGGEAAFRHTANRKPGDVLQP